MKVKQFEIWIADLQPQRGTETGKVRPILVIQSNLLNDVHPSVIVCPVTTNVEKDSEILRVHLKKGEANLKEESDIMIDQIRAIGKRRLLKRVGELPKELHKVVKENIKVVLDIE